MANEFFTETSNPQPSAPGSSAAIRAEFASVRAGFDKLPSMVGNGGKLVSINLAGSALEGSAVLVADLVVMPSPGALPAIDGSLVTNLNPNELGTVPIAVGGTGATDLAGAQAALGINLKANSLNTVLTGAPIAPTPGPADNSTRLATTAFVGTAIDAAVIAVGATLPSDATPLVNGVGASGIATDVSREDHVHPSDTTKANLASPTFTGAPLAPTQDSADDSTKISTTAWVRVYAYAKSVIDSALGLKAPLASPTFTGTVAVPTITPLGDVSNKPVNSAYLESWKTTLPSGVSVSDILPVIAGAASAGVSADASRVDHKHPTDTTRAALAANTFTGDQTIGNNNLKTIKTATFNSQVALATTTGAVTVDWSAAQNYKQNEPTGAITYTFTAPPGPCHLQLLIDSDGTSTAQTITWPGTVIWIGATWAGANNKKAIINFWYDGTNYFAMGGNQV